MTLPSPPLRFILPEVFIMGHFARPMLLFLWQGVPLRGLLTPPTPLCLFAATESAQERNLLPPQTATMKSLFVRLLLQGHANTKLPSPMTSHQQTVPPEDIVCEDSRSHSR
mmetsp:Transcript_37051/g.60010  ORF Transcript_37051/g.60010 Transcript_37051/m.60010 type:complete len:111 (+) Transcript_37051:28-360(+)